jgi:GTP-binding protein Era
MSAAGAADTSAPDAAATGTPAAGEFRSGSAALVGRPNVGKSSLLNALLGEKLSIVTPRPQTTRHRILGVLNLPHAQIAFVDTPGLHAHAARALNRAMNRTATSALAAADLAVLVVEAGRWSADDQLVLERIARAEHPAIAAVNKIDRVRPRERLLPYLAELGERYAFLELVPVSALKLDNVDDLRLTIAAHLPRAPARFPLGELTDRDQRFRIAEVIREKLTLELEQEVPYGIAVEVERLAVEGDQLTVDAAIWVARPGQKPIVIGARGERLKRVGRAARLALNEILGGRLHLNLWVKVRANWADNARALKELGLE